MYTNAKNGWYTVLNPNKVIRPIDDHMKSFRLNEDKIQLNYRSSLELKAIKYADFNKHVIKFALEPFNIQYLKPTDGKLHRYYIDLFIEFKTGDKFLVEVKSKGETQPPKKPKSQTQKAMVNYQRALQTYAVNEAKWKAAREFAKQNNMNFIILTERELS